MSEDVVAKFKVASKMQDIPRHFLGIGGPDVADKKASLHVKELNLNVMPWLMSSNGFQILSVGKHCNEDGFDFVWLGSKRMPPYTVRGDGSAVVPNVRDNIPYLDAVGNRDPHPRGACSKQVRLPLPPPRAGVYIVSTSYAASVTTTAARTTSATMTTHIKCCDMSTQTDPLPATSARDAHVRVIGSGSLGSKLSCPARAAETQEDKEK